ncbi:phosphomannomutase/phosphoglucomutase [Methylomagnum sp.]
MAQKSKPMSLGRLFFIIAAVVAAILVGCGAGLYFAAADSAREAGAGAARLLAENTARHMNLVLAQTGDLLEQLAQDPELGSALAGGNPARIIGVEERLTRLVPGAALVRLVPDSVEVPEETRIPNLGFADMDMVRQTKAGKPAPAFHAANTPSAHVAVVRRLAKGEGTLLASLPPKAVGGLLPTGFIQGAMELRQQNLSLGYVGDAALKDGGMAGEVPVPGTPWTLRYWGPASADPGWLWFLLLPTLAALLAVGGIGYAWFWLGRTLRHDLDAAATFMRDLSLGKTNRRYSLRLRETHRLISQLSPPKPQAVVNAEYPDAPSDAQSADDLDEGLDKFLHFKDLEAPTPVPPPPPPPPTPPAAPDITVSPALFRAADIGGVVGDTLTLDVARLLGRAIGSEVRERGENTVVIGRDGRLSSPDLSHALGRGLLSSGCSVIDLGLVPTPLLYFATHELGAKSGVMVAGSYNRANENGLRVVLGSEVATSKEIQRIRARIDRGEFSSGQGQIEVRNLARDYIERIAHDAQASRTMKIVVDAGNGAASQVAPAVLEQIGCEVVPLFCEVDGNFPNHQPDPSNPKNLEALARVVREQEADLGVAFDADGDRLGVVDSEGRIIWPDRQLMLLAADVLSREPGSDVLFDVKSTRHLSGYIVRHGGRPLMWKTGPAAIRAKMREADAMLAGEMSGHIFFKERWYGFDDAIYAAARLVEVLSADWRSTADVFDELPNTVNAPEIYIPLGEGENARIVEKLRQAAEFPEARVLDIDGLRVDFADGWGLIRASHNKPALALCFEGDSPEALERIKGRFKSLLLRVKPDIILPPNFTAM